MTAENAHADLLADPSGRELGLGWHAPTTSPTAVAESACQEPPSPFNINTGRRPG